MKKVNAAVIGMTAICVVLGFIIGIQLKTVKKQMSTTTDIQRVSDLSAELKNVKDENEVLSVKLKESTKKANEYEAALSNDGSAYKTLMDELDNLRKSAGFTSLKGRGVTVTIDDSRTIGGNDKADANAFLVHAEDILSVLNELSAAGAEAIAINDQRIISTSAVRCVGPVVNVNEVKLAAPFVITAIGAPDVLESALKIQGGVVDTLSPWGIQITIRKFQEVSVPAYSKNIEFKEAHTFDKED